MRGCFTRGFALLPLLVAARASPPHVLALLLDDYGWADAGWHAGNGSDVRTPTLDRLVASGIELERQYVFQVCSPSRSAAQTGRNPIHVNVQNLDPIFYNRNDNVSGFAGVPRPMTAIAQLLRDRAGYRTHFFGKWDAGMATADHLPSARGYDSALFYFHHMVNYWSSTFENANGAVSHFDSCADAAEKAGLPEGFRPVDLWRSNATRNAPAPVTLRNPPACDVGDWDICSDEASCPPYPGFPNATQMAGCTFEDDLFTRALLEAVDAHEPGNASFFAFWAPHAIHTPLMVPADWYAKFAHVADWRRRRYLALVAFIDDRVGAVVARLEERAMWDDLLIVMSSDNGGPIYSSGAAGANNFPLRGGKASNFEGGVRVNAFVSGGAVPAPMRGRTLAGLSTIWDWYATLAAAAGIEDVADASAAAAGVPPVDSVSQWDYWRGVNATPPRTMIALGLAETPTVQGVILDAGGGALWKLLVGEVSEDAWTSESFPNASTTEFPSHDCGDAGCLFRVDVDPCEYVDLAVSEPTMLARLQSARDAAQGGVFYPDRGDEDAASCVAAVVAHAGTWGPWVV